MELCFILSFGPGTMPTPRQATIQEIHDNFEAWESTLVKIIDVTFPEGGTYMGSKTLDDGTAEIIHFTRNDANFAGASVPDGPVTITAIVTQYDDHQVSIRNLGDIGQ